MNASTRAPSRGAAPGREADLRRIVEEVSHLLPAQAPIRRFVHHNTLHHFEHLPFEEAVVEGASVFGCEPFPTEEFFARETARGRITERDLDAVLAFDDEVQPERVSDQPLPFARWSRTDFRRFRMRHIIAWPGAAEIRFQVEEGEALTRMRSGVGEKARADFLDGGGVGESLSALWRGLSDGCAPRTVHRGGDDGGAEQAVQALLIRFCGAYLDQG